MAKQTGETTQAKVAEVARRQKGPAITEAERQRFIQAATYCLRNLPWLWTPGTPREEEAKDGSRQWIFPLYVRYPTGFEGYLGDLLFDGKEFTLLTERTVMEERARQIEADPALQREWDEYRASTLPSGKV